MLKCLLGHKWMTFMMDRVMVRQCANCGIVEKA